MASIDLKDAFFFFYKYLKFYFNNLFQFTGVSNGCGPALRVFIKISKAPPSHLLSKGQNSVVSVVSVSYSKENYHSRKIFHCHTSRRKYTRYTKTLS